MTNDQRQLDLEHDVIDHPKHYIRGGIECQQVAEAWDLDRYLFSILKYIMRAGYKPFPGLTIEQAEVRDLKKARWFLNRKIARLEKNNVVTLPENSQKNSSPQHSY